MTWRRNAAFAGGLIAATADVTGGRKLRAFYQDLDFEIGEDERLIARTDDGWDIAIYRYAAKGAAKPNPVLAGHGFAGSRLIWVLTRDTSLARYLTDAGYDFHAVDLRGRGLDAHVESATASHKETAHDG